MNYFKKLIKILGKIILFPLILSDYNKYRKDNNDNRFLVNFKDIYPCVLDKTNQTSFDRHYVYHTAWAARKLIEIRPEFHTDISSSLYFVSIASAFIPIKFYDFRPADLVLSGLQNKQGDLLSLPFKDGEIKSLSCLHVIEHIGLGRYGDYIDSNGDIKAAKELVRVLALGGSLLVVVPVGEPKIRFNAHRVYSKEMVIEMFNSLSLREFTLIPNQLGSPIFQADTKDVQKEKFGCGCFWFRKV